VNSASQLPGFQAEPRSDAPEPGFHILNLFFLYFLFFVLLFIFIFIFIGSKIQDKI
jgi:hypothetical protein